MTARLYNPLLFIPALFAWSLHAHAAIFEVDSTSDSLLSACTAAAADCSLRGAITAANATAAEDTIRFSIPSTDSGFQAATQHWRIDVSSAALPAIAEALIIDGYSQAGAMPNTNTPLQGGSNAILKIELRNSTGSNAVNGIDGTSNNFNLPLVVRGLAIHSFQSQIQLGGGLAQRVEGCFLGTTIDGTQAANTANINNLGIRVQGSGAVRIGGLTPDTRNVISGLANGIVFFGVTTGARIEGNLIGSNAAGTEAISPRAIGISAGFFPDLRIGGTDPNARNIISGNGFWGLRMDQGSASTAQVLGNFIGTDWSGSKAIANGLNPASPSQRVSNVILASLNCPVQLGGLLQGEANLIAYGADGGVRVDQCTAPVQRNRFLANNVAAIDNVFGGGAVGPTPNDPGDADSGGNRLQNFPELTLPAGFLPAGGLSVNLQYRVDTAPANATYPITVEFYRAGCGGGAERFLASDSYSAAEASTLKSFQLTAPDGGNVLPLVAVAVDAAGNVSEFGPMFGDAIFRSDFEDTAAPLTQGSCGR